MFFLGRCHSRHHLLFLLLLVEPFSKKFFYIVAQFVRVIRITPFVISPALLACVQSLLILVVSYYIYFYCCPVKTFSYGFREAGPLCETHCKPRSGAAVGGQGCEGRFPEGGLMPLALSRMYKSRFAELYFLMQLYPQLRRSAACSGFRIEVYLRHTPCALTR